jgi:elongation factor 1-gamma
MKLYSDKQNPHLNKILVVAKYNGVDLEVPEFDESAVKKNPTGKTPLLETPEGSIAGGYAIARYVAKLGKNRLFGSSVFDTASVEQWVDYAATDIDTPAAVWVFPILGLIPNNANATQKAKGDVRKALENLNKHLQTRTFLVGQRVTLADIVCSLLATPLRIGSRCSFQKAIHQHQQMVPHCCKPT